MTQHSMPILALLIKEIVEKWKFQQSSENLTSKHDYQCDLEQHTDWKTAIKPTQIGNRMVWVCRISIDSGNTWNTADISIPKWLYDYYMNGKARKISASQINHKIYNKI